MKFPSLFTKTPQHRRFSFTPRHYDPHEEERKAREERIRRELNEEQNKEINNDLGYRERIAGSFRTAKKTSTAQSDPSANMLRLIVLTFLVIWLIAVLQFGTKAVYGIFLIVPFYFYLKFRRK